MSLYVLDTDVLSLYRKGHALLTQRIDAWPASELAITVMTVEEQVSGWYRQLRSSKNSRDLATAYTELAMAIQFLGKWPILPFTEQAIDQFKRLKALRTKVRSMDLCIAAIALEHGATVVTRNLRDFQRIPGLTVEDWAV